MEPLGWNWQEGRVGGKREEVGEKGWVGARTKDGEIERKGGGGIVLTFHAFQMKELYAEGTIHQKIRCWAPGMEGWKPLDQIAQLKWMLVSTGNALINESELAALILNMFIRVCGFYPTRYDQGC